MQYETALPTVDGKNIATHLKSSLGYLFHENFVAAPPDSPKDNVEVRKLPSRWCNKLSSTLPLGEVGEGEEVAHGKKIAKEQQTFS